jgi:hypothetical protein
MQAGAEGATTSGKRAPFVTASFLLSSSIRKAYLFYMTKLLDRAVEAARALPPEMQDEVARILLQFTGVDQPVIQLTAEEKASLEASLAQAERGEFATDEEVRAIWAKHGL